MSNDDTNQPISETDEIETTSTGTFPPPIPVIPVTLAGTMDDLLKRPVTVLDGLHSSRSATIRRRLLLLIGGCLAVFGLILGMCSGEEQLWLTPLKVVVGVAASGLITLPSLYIFSCLNGLDVSLRSVAGVLVACLALVGLLLVGLAPVLWIFTQSTDSLPFLGGLTLLFWTVSLAFGLSLIFKTHSAVAAGKCRYLNLWVAIFVLVTLQMSTSLRPLIGTADTVLPQEKKFFLSHWVAEISRKAEDVPSR